MAMFDYHVAQKHLHLICSQLSNSILLTGLLTMIKLYQCDDLIEAQNVFDYLEYNNIEVKIFNAYANGALGEIPFTQTNPEIWLLNNDDYEKARLLIQAYKNEIRIRQNQADITVFCPQCKTANPASFDTCWSCLASLT